MGADHIAVLGKKVASLQHDIEWYNDGARDVDFWCRDWEAAE